jgi:hypothetical protein
VPPLWVRAVIAGVLLVSLAVAVLGPRPRRARSAREVGFVTWCGLACAGAGGAALAAGHRGYGALLVGLSVEWLLLAGWQLRSRPDDGGQDQDESPEPWPIDPEALDWERFEAEFRAYAERVAGSARAPA